MKKIRNKIVCISVVYFIFFLSSVVFSQARYNSYNLPNLVEYTSLKEALKSSDSVYILNLKREKLNEIPKSVFQLKSLRILVLSSNKIYSIPDEIANLTNLEELDISSNKFIQFPVSITKLKKLKVLKMNRNEIAELPEEIGNMTNLEQLIVWDNPLTTLPEGIGKLSNQMKTLNLNMTFIMDKDEIDKIYKLLPNTKIDFPSDCNCLK